MDVTPNRILNTEKGNMSEQMINQLNDLIRICRDGQKGYREAAQNVTGSDYLTIFEEYSKQRAEFANELAGVVISLNGTPDNDPNMMSALHRFLIDLRATLTNGDPAAILAECIRGEEVALNAYNEALQNDVLSGLSHEVVQRQSNLIDDALKRMQLLREGETA